MPTLCSRFRSPGSVRGGWAMLALVAALATLVAFPARAQLTNPDFDSGIGGWTSYPSPTAGPDWDEFAGDPSPGSARIRSEGAPGSHEFPRLGQCFALGPGIEVAASARVWGEQVRLEDSCGVELFFYTCGNCACASIDNAFSGGVSTSIGWQTVLDKETAPGGTAGVAVHLWAHLAPTVPGFTRGGGFEPTDCRYDTVRLTIRLFADGFEGGTVCAWSDATGSNDNCNPT